MFRKMESKCCCHNYLIRRILFIKKMSLAAKLVQIWQTHIQSRKNSTHLNTSKGPDLKKLEPTARPNRLGIGKFSPLATPDPGVCSWITIRYLCFIKKSYDKVMIVTKPLQIVSDTRTFRLSRVFCEFSVLKISQS